MPHLLISMERPPIFVGAGIIKEPGQIQQVIGDENLAAAILGSYTEPEWAGNDEGGRKNVEHWDPENQAYYNSIGLKNPGRKKASRYLPDSCKALKDSGILPMISVTTLKGEDPLRVLPDMVEWALEMGADAVEVNGSCPNQSPEHPLMCFDIDATEMVAQAIRERVGYIATVGYKVSPMPREIIDVYGSAHLPFDFYDVTNTLGNQQSPVNPLTGEPFIEVNNGLAGMSGPAIAYLSRENLDHWVAAFEDNASIAPQFLSMGGVDSMLNNRDAHEIYARVHNYGALMVGGAQEFRRAADVRTVAARWAANYAYSLDIFPSES